MTSQSTAGDAATVAPIKFPLRVRPVLYVLLGIDAALIAIFFISRPLRTVFGSDLVMFDVNSEPTFITWYSILKLAGIAVILAIIAGSERRAQTKWWRHWYALSGVILLLSLDEFLQIHERLAAPTRSLFGIVSGPFYLAWVIPGVLLVLATAALFLRFVLAQPKQVRLTIFIAAALFVAGALGLEVVASAGYSFGGMTSALEEFLEMSGMSVFVFGLLLKLRETTNRSIAVSID